jgi:enoyl-CoA hydratase/carnithine racemase
MHPSPPVTLRLEREPPVATVTLCQPERLNALSPQAMAELLDACQHLAGDTDCHVVRLRGAGRAFCAGFDIDALACAVTHDAEGADLGRRLIDAWSALPQVTLASVHGTCIGGGVLLAAACDLRIAAEDTQFALPEVELGLPLAWAGMPRLVRLVGPAVAAELVLDATPFDAAQALQWRLVNRVVDAAPLDAEAAAWARRLASRPPTVLRAVKRRWAQAVEALSPALGDASDTRDLLDALADPASQAARAAYLKAQGR